MLFGQIPLVLGLQVGAPVDRVFKLLAAVLKNFNGIGVTYSCEIAGCHMIQPGEQFPINEFVEEFQFVFAFDQQVADYAFQHSLG